MVVRLPDRYKRCQHRKTARRSSLRRAVCTNYQKNKKNTLTNPSADGILTCYYLRKGARIPLLIVYSIADFNAHYNRLRE